MNKILPALALSIFATSAMALEPLPDEAGFSAFLGAGAAGGIVESNFLAEIVGVDLSNDKIHNYDSPSDTTIIIPNLDLDLAYTFSNMKTQISLGNAVENSLDFTTNTTLALRHDFDFIGHFELAGLADSQAGLKVWEDPYLQGEDRKTTDYETNGGRITWDRMFGSNIELIVSTWEVEVDKERSGQSLDDLDDFERKLLDREGDVNRAELGYLFEFNGGELLMRPNITYIDRDLDGKAMAQDGYELGVLFVYNNPEYTWVNHASYQSLDGDKENPIFGSKNDAKVYSLASEINIHEPFGWEKWTTSVGVLWARNDADIDFNKSTVAMFSASMGRSF